MGIMPGEQKRKARSAKLKGGRHLEGEQPAKQPAKRPKGSKKAPGGSIDPRIEVVEVPAGKPLGRKRKWRRVAGDLARAGLPHRREVGPRTSDDPPSVDVSSMIPPLASVGRSEDVAGASGPITDPLDVSEMGALLELDAAEIAAKMRRAGHDYRAIGRKLGVPPERAHQIVKAEIMRRREMMTDDLETVRHLELERLDELWRKAYGWIRLGPDARMVEAALKIQVRRAELLGLDAPKKHELKGEIDLQVRGRIEQLAMIAAKVVGPDVDLTQPAPSSFFGPAYQIQSIDDEDRRKELAPPPPAVALEDARHELEAAEARVKAREPVPEVDIEAAVSPPFPDVPTPSIVDDLN